MASYGKAWKCCSRTALYTLTISSNLREYILHLNSEKFVVMTLLDNQHLQGYFSKKLGKKDFLKYKYVQNKLSLEWVSKFLASSLIQIYLVLITGSRRPEVFCKKDVLRSFTKFLGKHLCQSLFFNKVAAQCLQLY